MKAVTADGLSANLKAAKLLGCEIRAENPKPFFKHPHPKFKAENVFYICNAAHMLKLMRNLLAHVTNSVLLPQDEAIQNCYSSPSTSDFARQILKEDAQ